MQGKQSKFSKGFDYSIIYIFPSSKNTELRSSPDFLNIISNDNNTIRNI